MARETGGRRRGSVVEGDRQRLAPGRAGRYKTRNAAASKPAGRASATAWCRRLGGRPARGGWGASSRCSRDGGNGAALARAGPLNPGCAVGSPTAIAQPHHSAGVPVGASEAPARHRPVAGKKAPTSISAGSGSPSRGARRKPAAVRSSVGQARPGVAASTPTDQAVRPLSPAQPRRSRSSRLPRTRARGDRAARSRRRARRPSVPRPPAGAGPASLKQHVAGGNARQAERSWSARSQPANRPTGDYRVRGGRSPEPPGTRKHRAQRCWPRPEQARHTGRARLSGNCSPA